MSRFLGQKVGVISGGLSNERAVSLKTGAAVRHALLELGHDVASIDAGHDLVQQLIQHRVSVVFNALHGTYGEDGRLQGLLDWMQIPYTGEGAWSSLVSFHKGLAKGCYRSAGVPIARDVCVNRDDAARLKLSELPFGLPLVVKPTAEGSSVGVTIVREPHEFAPALANAGDELLIEEFVSGVECSVVILGDQVLGSVEIEPTRTFYDYTAKYEAQDTQYHVPPRLSSAEVSAVESVGFQAHRALNCRAVTRTDVILGPNGPIALETNTLPGMTESSLVPKVAAYAGMTFPSLIQDILNRADCAAGGDHDR